MGTPINGLGRVPNRRAAIVVAGCTGSAQSVRLPLTRGRFAASRSCTPRGRAVQSGRWRKTAFEKCVLGQVPVSVGECGRPDLRAVGVLPEKKKGPLGHPGILGAGLTNAGPRTTITSSPRRDWLFPRENSREISIWLNPESQYCLKTAVKFYLMFNLLSVTCELNTFPERGNIWCFSDYF